MKKALVIVGGILVLLVIVAAALPFFINVNSFKPTIETDLTTALGRKVAIGNIGLSILSGSVTVDDVSIADDPAFSKNPFLTAKQLAVGVQMMPLIFSRKVNVETITIAEPQVALIHAANGTWNFSSLGAGASQPKSTSSSSPDMNGLSVAKLKISNGSFTVVQPGGKVRTYDKVNLDASNISYTSEFPFTLTAATPGDGSVKLDGKAGPVDSKDASLTPFHATIGVSHFDLASTGFVDPASGLAGVVDFNGVVTSDGKLMNSRGTLTANKLKVVPNGQPSGVPVSVDYDTDYNLKDQTGLLKDGTVHIGKATAHMAGTYNTGGAVTSVQLKLNGQAMPVPDLEGVLPAVGVTLPSGASLKSGTLDMTLAASGPVDKLVITGPINLSNAQLAGFNLKSKLGALGSFAGLGGASGSDTVIQTLSANMRVDPSGENADNLNLVVPTIGTITGTGNVSSAGQLNCKMLAKLAGGLGSVTSAITSFGGSKNSQGIPFKITGTTSNPVFVPDMAGVAGNMVKGLGSDGGSAASAAQGIIGGLFGKKKN